MTLEDKQVKLAWKLVDYTKDLDFFEFNDCYNSEEEAYEDYLPLLSSRKSLNNLIHDINEDINNMEDKLDGSEKDKETNKFLDRAYELTKELYQYKRDLSQTEEKVR